MTSIISNPTAPTFTLPTHPTSLLPEITPCITLSHLKQTHAYMIKTGKIHDPLAAAELLKSYALNHHDIPSAYSIFCQMQHPNCFSWNTIIRALAESGKYCDVSKALTLFCQLLCDDAVEPNRFTFPSMLKACGKMGRLEEGKQVHGMVVKLGFDSDEFVASTVLRFYVLCGLMADAYALFSRRCVSGSRNIEEVVNLRRKDGDIVMWNVMIDGFVKSGDLIAARKMFNEMPDKSVVSWNALISGYAQNGKFREAVEHFRKMQAGDISPNYVTLVSILPAISHLGAIELGKWVHLYAEKNGIEIGDELGSALVDMYSKCGSIDRALQVFEKLQKRNVATWNAMIGGLAMHGRARNAIDHFWKMERYGVRRSDVTYIAVLSACSHAGFVEEGKSFFNRMTEVDGFAPRIEHYGCMVDLLGRAGCLDEVEEFILKLPIEPDDVIWKSLLGACKLHGDVVMGECVAKRLMKLAPRDSGSYVALSNIFASAGNWQGVSDVRLMMKDVDIRKDPGCSWIEVKGSIHEFNVEDDLHPRAAEIRLMLEEIMEALRSAGYKHNTAQVFLNFDEDSKESALHFHSEKIAVAFGLIGTKPGTPLRVFKNLRICEDCHASMKLISKIFGRIIVVRDRKRFHHFEDGLCSCGEFW